MTNEELESAILTWSEGKTDWEVNHFLTEFLIGNIQFESWAKETFGLYDWNEVCDMSTDQVDSSVENALSLLIELAQDESKTLGDIRSALNVRGFPKLADTVRRLELNGKLLDKTRNLY